MSDLKIGSKVYIFDQNCRVYKKTSDGRSTGAPSYRGYFRQVEIIGESPRKWKTLYCDAVKKNPYQTGFYTAEMVDYKVWDNEHRYKIADKVRNGATTEQLKEIAKIIGIA